MPSLLHSVMFRLNWGSTLFWPKPARSIANSMPAALAFSQSMFPCHWETSTPILYPLTLYLLVTPGPKPARG